MIPQGRQSPEHPGFVTPDEPYDCRACIAWHGQKYAFPDLEPDDFEAWHLFLLLQDQQRIGMEPIGLDYNVLPAVFDLEGVPQDRRRRRFHELVTLNHVSQAHWAGERKKRQEADRARKAPGR